MSSKNVNAPSIAPHASGDQTDNDDEILRSFSSLQSVTSQSEPELELRRPYEAQTPTKYRKPLPGSKVVARTRSPVPTKTMIAPSPMTVPTEQKKKERPVSPTADSSNLHRRPSSPSLHEFQRAVDLPTVHVRHVHLPQRSAFAQRPIAPLLREWEEALARSGRAHRLSPSHQYLQILHRLQNQSVVRQVQFSPSTGLDADYFVSLQSLLEEGDEDNGVVIRDGRYRAIDPLRHLFCGVEPGVNTDFRSMTPPRLSHRRYRLPSRADVGFGQASETEIRMKQKEIREESMWEEARLRLSVAVTSDDLGGTSLEEILSARALQRVDQQRHWDMGMGGRHLRLALARNARHFAHRQRRMSRNDPSCRPNPYSMLAPPVDSTYSPSQGWRPRAFHDRPAGFRYCYVVPNSVAIRSPGEPSSSLSAGRSSEKRIGSLTLYTLPPMSKRLNRHTATAASAAAHHCEKSGAAPAFGKISEAFWFPVSSIDGSHVEDVDSRKAIFSFNPFDLVMESSSGSRSCGPDSLYVVLQIYEMVSLTMDSQTLETELLKSVAFGVTKAFSDTAMTWPEGLVKDLQLYASPMESESEQAFVERLWILVHQKSLFKPRDNAPVTHHDDSSILTGSSYDPPKNGHGLRLFRSPKRSRTPPRLGDHHNRSQSASSLIAPLRDRAFPVFPIVGNAKIFVSFLSHDFLQCMLASSSDLSASANDMHLVDVSGDFAVRLDPTKMESSSDVISNNHTDIMNKRSNLVRLPLHDVPAGYSNSGGFREVLYLPARPEKQYDVDSHMTPGRSFLNLLYIYPCLLRTSPSLKDDKILGSQYTVRIRILHNLFPNDPSTTDLQSIPCFYDRAPWNGMGLLHTVFSNIFEISSTSGSGIETKHANRDEIKVRLPEVLDGNFKIQFTLFSVQKDNASCLKLSPISEAFIPLTSSRLRDTSSGSRVATIIPNGKHRLELGGYHLHFETRVVSSLHISDPVVAATIRGMGSGSVQGDYPVPKSQISRSFSGSSVPVQFVEATASRFAESSLSSIVSSFQYLTHMQLSRILESDSREESVAVECFESICFWVAKVKDYLMSKDGSAGTEKFNAFVKIYLDLFDEAVFFISKGSPSLYGNEDDNVIVSSDYIYPESHGTGIEGVEVALTEMDLDDTSSRLGESHARRNRRHSRSIRQASSFASDGQPFSRSAFGASKLDKIRAIAELRQESSHFHPFFDDDETIATALSAHSGRRFVAPPDAAKDSRSSENHHVDGTIASTNSLDDNSITRPVSVSSRLPLGETEFVKRVRIAATMVIAPCVNPSLSSILKHSASPRAISGTLRNPFIGSEHKEDSNVFARTARCLCSPGSDIEQDPPSFHAESANPSLKIGLASAARSGLKAGEETVSVFSLDNHASKHDSDVSRSFLYESLIKSYVLACTSQGTSHSFEVGNSVASDHLCAMTNEVYRTKTLLRSDILMQTDFLLPFCLKSIVLRYRGQEFLSENKVLADESQVLLLESFIGVLAEQLINLAIKSSRAVQDRENSVKRALSASQVVLDFLIGLISIFHTKQIQGFVLKYFGALRDAEKLSRIAVGDADENADSTVDILLHSVVSSRKLRLLAVETFASMPSFLALNLPMKFSSQIESHPSETASWLKQYIVDEAHAPSSFQELPNIDDSVPSGWLARIVVNECLLMCSMSSKTVIEELLAVVDASSGSSPRKSVMKKRSEVVLSQDDVLLLHTLAVHAIQIVYELVVRRHSLDRRFQSESAQTRIAGLLTEPIMELSCANVRWLGRLDSSNVVRSTWLLCFIYVLQEAPEALIYDFIHSCCDPKDIRLHDFIRLLELCSSTFQHFLHLERFPYPSEEDQIMSPWLLQESFNTICAASIVVVDLCLEVQSLSPHDVNKAMQVIAELLLEILTVPQSPVTLLRAVGAALQIVEADIDLFMNAVGDSLQHWLRVMLTLMNSQSLSVRSIAVDFMISLLCTFFDRHGAIDALTVVFASVLPEVVSREIALYSVGYLITTMDDVAKAVWPIRRALADIADAHPSDDTRVDPVLPPVISIFCRACQAVIDGVLVELRLQKDSLMILGTAVQTDSISRIAFDADEESVYEAASFFAPETAPIQRMRWLMTLKRLHTSRSQWAEAAECLFLCAHTVCDSMFHMKLIWRPSRFLLWSDPERSTWLHTVGDADRPGLKNIAVMQFAENFLEPIDGLNFPGKQVESRGKVYLPTIMEMSIFLTSIVKEAMEFYGKEVGFEKFAHHRWASLVKAMLPLMEQFQSYHTSATFRAKGVRIKHNEEAMALQMAWTRICGFQSLDNLTLQENVRRLPFFVTLRLYGKKPSRFEESTAIPTFLEWDKLCLCRVPSCMLQRDLSDDEICLRFANAFRTSLCHDVGANQFLLRTRPSGDEDLIEGITYLDVLPVHVEGTAGGSSVRPTWKRFRSIFPSGAFQTTVAHEFPGALSRQTAVVATGLPAAHDTAFMIA